ncbi:MAG: GAF domain-containing SpoIIE family protein phosphatase [Leptolyngbyaceae bacterium]|nr:GAF domain-containing SpoIIE family protein phosphatase [Leptolyngbyaceae bacterium]
MSQISLKRLLAKKEVASLVQEAINATGMQIGITDIKDNLLLGSLPQSTYEKYPIELADETIGWILSSQEPVLISSLLAHVTSEALEKKLLATEVLEKYKEINLLYDLSEKITANLDLQVVANLALSETQKIVVGTSVSMMLLDEKTGYFDSDLIFGSLETDCDAQQFIQCRHTIATEVINSGRGEIINDFSSDPRFKEANLPISSLISVPLKVGDRVIGVLNISNRDPVTYTAADLKFLTTVASQASQAIETVRHHENSLKEAVARTEIEKGRQIQQDFLPDTILQLPGWEIAAAFTPARQVAGDFYDVFLLPDHSVGLVIADVCDKGVGAALFMALFRSLIRVFSGQTALDGLSILTEQLSTSAGKSVIATTDTNPSHIHALRAVELTNNYVAQNHGNLGMFATLFFGVLDPATGLLSYVNGGHELPIILNSQGEVKQRLKPTGPAVGMLPGMSFKVNQTYLELGDTLVTYTDGVPEARSPSGTFFTEKQLLSLVEGSEHSACELLAKIEGSLATFIDTADQFDDITLLAVSRTLV